MLALIAVSMFDVTVLQTGSSPGKWIFFLVWMLLVALALPLRSTGRATGFCLTVAGCMSVAIALVAVWRSDLPVSPVATGVNLGFLAVGIVLSVIGMRIRWLYLE